MKRNGIVQKALHFRDIYGKIPARRICKDLGILLFDMPLGTDPESLKGMFVISRRISTITMNSDLPDRLYNFVLLHEIGHAILHRKQAEVCKAFCDKSMYAEADTMEAEANLFAAEYTMTDEEVLHALNEYGTYDGAAAILGVPLPILNIKLDSMQQRGYDVEPMSLTRSDFLYDFEQGE